MTEIKHEKCTVCEKRQRVTKALCQKCATEGVTCSRDGCMRPAIGEESQATFDHWCAFHRAQDFAEIKARMGAEKAKPWFIIAAVVAAMGIAITLLRSNIYRSESSGRRIDCGTIFAPAFPRDGRGPCTDILATQQNQLVVCLVVCAALAGIGLWQRYK